MADGIQHLRPFESSTDSTARQSTADRTDRLGKEEFLKLLTAQLRLQNPLDPIDNTEFVAQLAQFSQVEQLIAMKTLLEQQIQTNLLLTQSITNLSAATLVGRPATVRTSTVGWNGKAVDIGYRLPVAAQSVTVRIQDQNGMPIRTYEYGYQPADTYWIQWDGKDDQGNVVPHGTYTVVVDATTADGAVLDPTLLLRGTIESVRFSEEGAQIVIYQIPYPIADVTEISG